MPRIPRIPNDRISNLLTDMVPDELQGTDRFLDIIAWNIKFFNQRDPQRILNIASIMEELNADLFVLEEIEKGSLDPVVQRLNDRGAGLYKVVYGSTGGDQRVAIMYDMEWVRATSNITELFADENLRTSNGKSVFPRLPLQGHFTVRTQQDPFTFDFAGVHLKSQLGPNRSMEQRKLAAERLLKWVKEEASDEDVIIAGDWNAAPDKEEWQVLHQAEHNGEIKFSDWNNGGEPSHLSKSGRSTRLDLVIVSPSVEDIANRPGTTVIRWNNLLATSELRTFVIDNISDHLPVISRFFFNDANSN